MNADFLARLERLEAVAPSSAQRRAQIEQDARDFDERMNRLCERANAMNDRLPTMTPEEQRGALAVIASHVDLVEQAERWGLSDASERWGLNNARL